MISTVATAHPGAQIIFPGIRELTSEEIETVVGGDAQTDGSVKVAEGVALYGAATLALLTVSGPIGWAAIGAYWVTCAAAGYIIGTGIAQYN